MHIEIHPSTTLKEIRKQFNRHFNCLKLEFFFNGRRNVYKITNMISDHESTVAEVGGICKMELISINGNQKTSTLEDHFLKYFNLYVQVFRKSGRNWLETSSTDQITLSVQNRMGRESLISLKREAVDPEFYHEQV